MPRFSIIWAIQINKTQAITTPGVYFYEKHFNKGMIETINNGFNAINKLRTAVRGSRGILANQGVPLLRVFKPSLIEIGCCTPTAHDTGPAISMQFHIFDNFDIPNPRSVLR